MTGAAVSPQGRRLSIAHLALLVPWVALVIDAWDPIRDNSFLWHIRAGTVQAGRGTVLTTDPFSFTMSGEPWRTQSWLVELFYGWAEGLTALGFVPYMILLIGTLTFITVGLIAYRYSRSVPATAFVLVLSTLALISFLVPRPVLFSYLLMALVVLAWDSPRTRWAVPFLFWIWAAVHASFTIGLVYVGLSLMMRRQWGHTTTALASGLAALATAHGLGVLSFLIDFEANSGALQYLSEWRRPELLEAVFLPFLGSVIFIVSGAFRARVYPRHLWLIVPFALLGFSSVRAIPPAFLGLAPVLALSLAGLEIGSRAGLRPRLAGVFGVVVLVLPFWMISGAEISDERFPTEAVAALDPVNTFHDDVVGGYLIWARGPGLKVFLDDRAELYGRRLGEFVGVRRGEIPWEAIFRRDGIQQAVLANDEKLRNDLIAAGWVVVHADDDFTVLRPGGI